MTSSQTYVEKKTFQGIIDVLSVFAKTGAYGVIDRIAGALTHKAVEHALYDAIRSLNAMIRQAITVKIKVDDEEKELKIIDWTTNLDDPRYQLADKGKVIEGPAEIKGRTIRYVSVPEPPSQEEIDDFLREVKERGFEGLSIARRVALLSLTPYRRR
mgnify:CR=1 FL=1